MTFLPEVSHFEAWARVFSSRIRFSACGFRVAVNDLYKLL